MWLPVHTRLQEVCIDLWPTVEECRALVAEAGVDSSRMTFGEPPALRWESVIIQCDKQRSLDMLVPILLDRYPRNPILGEAVQPWIKGNPKEKSRVRRQPAKIQEEPVAVVKVYGSEAEQMDGEESEVNEADEEIEMVSVQVPKQYSEEATTALTSTINSLRKTVAQHEKNLQELIDWRLAISTLSRAEVAAKTGGNERESSNSKFQTN